MVESDSLNQLIERLQRLHLEQERILQALKNIAIIATVDQEPSANIDINIESPFAAVIASTTQVKEHDRTPTSVTGFHIGQQVYIITNRITHVLICRATEADRTAIVTHFTASNCVTIHTINGFHTHQHPKNLHPL
jgi:hypothetical protein